MDRQAAKYLKNWKSKVGRKPLIIRGARQVGKSYLVRAFALESGLTLIELNFEKTPDLSDLFKSNDPSKILKLLEVQCNCEITPATSLLFLDEIQAAPALIPCLRYFFEELPDLHVIAAGSLLEFTLADHSFPMPVGRVDYLFLGPMQFEEFLQAMGEDKLYQFLHEFQFKDDVPQSIHDRLMEFVKLYCLVGGMPEAISVYQKTKSLQQVEEVKRNILSAYTDDFAKYRPRIHYERILKVFRKAPLLIGEKIKYVNIDPHERSKDLSESLHLLSMAHLIHPVVHSACNGIPLGAEVNAKIFKILFLDVGLVSTACGLGFLDYEKEDDLQLVNQGKISEQFVGQYLLDMRPLYAPPELYYWVREQKSASAEVDYVIALGSQIVPVEVKSGKTGTLKSLQIFIKEKNRQVAVRISSQIPSVADVQTSLPGSESTPFQLISIPFYLVGQLERLMSTVRCGA
jgi:predicted AAA+ superfamily ATPase